MPLDVLYDHTVFARQPYGGISRYYAELIPRVAANPSMAVSVFMGLHVNEYGLEKSRRGFARFFGIRRPVRRGTYKLTRGLNDRLFRWFASGHQSDIYHSTSYRQLLDSFGGARVVTCHDMIVERTTGQMSPTDDLNIGKREALLQADGVICISENTRRDVIEMTGIAEAKTRVIYHANGLREEASPGAPFEFPYLLFVGARGDYKNFRLLLEAYASDHSLRSALHLVCFGGGPLTAAELEEADRLGIAKAVHWVMGTDQRLATLYAHAAAFVYPSLYEGFGIPLLEAMAYGCPVVSSSNSSLPEVGGDAAAYFDPHSVEDLRQKITQVVSDSSFRQALIERGRHREKQFDWDKTAAQTVEFYRQVSGL